MLPRLIGGRRLRGPAARRRGARRVMVEGLEERRLLSATVTTVAAFSAADDFSVQAVDAAGNIYGSTATAVIEVAAGTHKQSTIATFPAAVAIDASGNIFLGGPSGLSEIAAGTHAITQIPGLTNVDDLILDRAGNIYGVARPNPNEEYQFELFRFSAGTRSVSDLGSFGLGDGGWYGPYSLSVDADGDLYWAIQTDEPNSVVELAAGSHTPEGFFMPQTLEGSVNDVAADPAGNVFIVSGFDVVLRIAARTGVMTTLGAPSSDELLSLVVDNRGDLFGTAESNNKPNAGEIFEVPEGQTAASTVASFQLGDEGSMRILGADNAGNIYLTASDGSDSGVSIFEVGDSGFVSGPSAPAISNQPNNQTGVVNGDASFSAAIGSSPAAAVRWQVSTDGGRHFGDITGNATAGTGTLVLSELVPSQNGTWYRAVFTNSLGTATSDAVKLAVVPLVLVQAADAGLSTFTETTVTLSALADAAGGEAGVSYRWSAIRLPAGAARPTLSANGTNAARHAVVTFHKAGRYVFRCTISDGEGDRVRSDVQVVVLEQQTSLRVTPHDQAVGVGKEITFHYAIYDQFGHPFDEDVDESAGIQFILLSGPGMIDPYSGVFSSDEPGAVVIEAANGANLAGTVGLQVVG